MRTYRSVVSERTHHTTGILRGLGFLAAMLLAVLLLAALALSAGNSSYASSPAVRSAGQDRARSWPPFVRVVPQSNSDDALVYAEGIAYTVDRRLKAVFGETMHDWSHTNLEYDSETERYQGMAVGALSQHCPFAGACLRLSESTGQWKPASEVLVTYDFQDEGPDSAPDFALQTAQLRFSMPPFVDGIRHRVVLLIPPVGPQSLPAGWWQVPGGLYVIESDGVDGQLRASLAIGYDPDVLDWYGFDAADLRMLRWMPAEHRWAPLPTSVNAVAHRASASTDHLTAYTLAALAKPTWLPLIRR